MNESEDDLTIALRSLKNQKIAVSRSIPGPDGLIFNVMGHMLTGPQIVKLHEYGRLYAQGIKEFAKSVEGEPNPGTAMPEQ
jgi:hypothetical protein